MWEDAWRTNEERRRARDLRRTNYALLPFLFACLVFIAMHFNLAQMSAASTALMWGAGCLISGTAIGFIFSIPRVVPGTAPEGGSDGASDRTDADIETPTTRYEGQQLQVNSNLVEISDWLTKIIVGLGLVNLEEIPGRLDRLANALAQGLGSAACAQTRCPDYAFALGLIIAFAVLGFLMGYLYTRLFLAGAFRRADDSLQLRDKVTRILLQEGVSQDESEAEVTPAQIEVAERVSNLPLAAQEGTAVAELMRLAREYDSVRNTMLPGTRRTRRMTAIVTRMRALALVAYAHLDRFTKAASPGERLGAIAMLQVRPKKDYLQWLLDRVNLEKPFIAFHALEALRRAALELGDQARAEVRALLQQFAQSERGQVLLKADDDRGHLFQRVLDALKESPAKETTTGGEDRG